MSVPVALRRQFGFDKTKKALVYVKDDKIIVEPVKDLLELGGSLKTTKKPLSRAKLRKLFGESLVAHALS